MNIIFWYIRNENLKHINNFISQFSNFMSLITKVNLFTDIDNIDNLNKNVNLIINSDNNENKNINNKKINIFFLEKILNDTTNDNILIIFLDLEKMDENYLFNNFKEIKKSQYSKFLFLPFKIKTINKTIETIALNFIHENISKKNVLDVLNIDIEINNKKLEKILKKIREI